MEDDEEYEMELGQNRENSLGIDKGRNYFWNITKKVISL